MRAFTTLSILFIFITSLNAQKVGVVLSGGGAKGMAHIGVLEVLEENNIPIDYIAGTSIGAIVGSLYATGYTPEEMRKLFVSDEFKLWSSGKLSNDDIYFFERVDQDPIWFDFEITKTDDKIKILLPTSIISQKQMDFAFMELMAQSNAACDYNFDNLMVPFRCISTSVTSKREIIHKDGNIGEAVRASMTFPVYFKPIEIDGELLFDGGIMNNFPVDVMAEDFQPDIIIGHKVASNTVPDADDIFAQIEAMVMQETKYEVPDSLGILLSTEFESISLLDFNRTDYISGRGHQTALDSIEVIKSRIQRRVSNEELQKKRDEFKNRLPELYFGDVEVEGVEDEIFQSYIKQAIKLGQEVVSLDDLRTAYFMLIQDQHIKSIRPKAKYNKETNLFDLVLEVDLASPFELSLGGYITTASNTLGFISARYKFFRNSAYTINANLYFGRLYNSFEIGGRVDPVTKNPFYLAAHYANNVWDYYTPNQDLLFTDSKPLYVLRREHNFRIDAGIPYSNYGVLNFGASQSVANDQYYRVKSFSKSDVVDNTEFKAYNVYGSIKRNNYDYINFATSGAEKLLKIQFITGHEYYTPGSTTTDQPSESDHSFLQMTGRYGNYWRLGRKVSLGGLAEAVFNNNDLMSNYYASIIQAPNFSPTPFSKTLFIENFRANEFFAGGAKFIFHINETLHFRAEGYGFFPARRILQLETGEVAFEEDYFTSWKGMASFSVVQQTSLGPLSFSLNYFEKDATRWYGSVNFGYVLFNKRGY